MTRPIDINEAERRDLLILPPEKGIHTFSNGDEWICWAEDNCFECAFYDHDGSAGEYCAFEGASIGGMVSPALAVLFGWMQDEKYPECYDYPDKCPFFTQRAKTEDGSFPTPPPPPDPNQMSLLEGAA